MIDDRTIQLIGADNLKLIEKARVCVIGLGGVGSIVPISLVRSGVKNLLIIDGDIVDESNLNRQIAYTLKDVGKNKADCLKNILLGLRNDISIESKVERISESTDLSFLKEYDYVVDCIDDINAKVLLIKYCFENNLNIICSLGMGNRLDPSKVILTNLDKTTDDPLAKKMRGILRKENIKLSKIKVAFSLEKPIIKSRVIGSMVYVPNEAGLLISSYIIQKLIQL